MNIFATSPDPQRCAEDLDDARVVNQLRETVQLLSTAVFFSGSCLYDPSWMYKPAHNNHPVTKWVGKSRQNFQWTVDHAVALSNEYHLRFPGSHKSADLAWRFLAGREYLGQLFELEADPQALAYGEFFQVPIRAIYPISFADCARNQSLGLDFRNHPGGVHEGYRAYLAARWNTAPVPPRWRNGQPEWFR